jgi:hypothetical protein
MNADAGTTAHSADGAILAVAAAEHWSQKSLK